MEIKLRFAMIGLLAEQYQSFRDFASDGMAFLGFTLSDMQGDIAEYMQHGPRLRMVMAQRGEAKTTLAALFAIWKLIHRPSTRVLIVSAGEDNSKDTATLIVRIIMMWDILECLRPDKQAGDRTSVEAFDVHYALKGLDRSPSIACVGVTANLPGRRADLLIPDDIESNKNGLTVVQRQQLLQSSKEFSSICTHGDIMYLGTPQSKDSVYNSLEQRGFEVRIWPGRYPTPSQLEKYGQRLAPYLAQRIERDPSLQTGGGIDGTEGQPADPIRYTDEDLIEKFLDKGPEDFALQYMLDTSLLDAQRQQLKLSDLVVANFGIDAVPEIVSWQAVPQYQVPLDREFPIPMTKMYYAVQGLGTFVAPPKERLMYVDPAGGGTDEIGYAVGFAVGSYIHAVEVGGLSGGLITENENKLVEIVRELGVTDILCESNMGHGQFELNLRGILSKHKLDHVIVSGEYSTGQKEKRIIGRLVSAMQRHRLVVYPRIFDVEKEQLRRYSPEKRTQYSLWYQLANITTDRNSLVHDDRLEALSGLVNRFAAVLQINEEAAAEKRKLEEHREWVRNPMGYAMEREVRGGARSRMLSARKRK